MPVKTRCLVTLAGTALAVIGADQVTKAITVATREGRPPVHLIGRVLTIDVSRNAGAAFSFAPAATLIYTCVAVAVAAAILINAPRLRSAAWAAALGLLLGGAIGNLCDRLARAPGIGRGAVIDFIDLQHFATFNIADSCLTCGAVLVVLLTLLGVPVNGRPATARNDAATAA